MLAPEARRVPTTTPSERAEPALGKPGIMPRGDLPASFRHKQPIEVRVPSPHAPQVCMDRTQAYA
jgi:hypothetical protein